MGQIIIAMVVAYYASTSCMEQNFITGEQAAAVKNTTVDMWDGASDQLQQQVKDYVANKAPPKDYCEMIAGRFSGGE